MSASSGADTERRPRILVVDDDPAAGRGLARLLSEEFEVEVEADPERALARLQAAPFDALVTDLRMPGIDGLALLGRARTAQPEIVRVVITGFADLESAVQALEDGADDYLAKPVEVDELVVVLRRALAHRRVMRDAAALRLRGAERPRSRRMIGTSHAMQEVFRIVDRVAESRATVLVTGESGTGKEVVARAIHEASPRARKPFVKLHCAALAESLLESELFGHEKGSFTGANARREGHFKLADGGTLFLDEIGEISASTQVKLLRFLQERTFERVGGTETLKVDVRIIAATNRDLGEEVARGRFREDLYYRLNVVHVHMPPLRIRQDDVMPLATHFLERFARENQKGVTRFSPEAAARIRQYPWPGNVRELENVVERAVVLCEGPQLTDIDLPTQEDGTVSNAMSMKSFPVGVKLKELERQAILAAIDATGGSTTSAARMLGISVRKVQYRLHAYGRAARRDPPPPDDADGEPTPPPS